MQRDRVRAGKPIALFVLAIALIVPASAAAVTCTPLLEFGGAGSGAGQLSAPGDVAIDSEDNAWVLDTGHNRVQKFDSEGEFVLQFGAKGNGNGQFNSPTGIAVDSEDHVWVASGGSRVQEFNSAGEFVQSWKPSTEVTTGNPTGIAIDPEGNVWLAGVFFAGFGEEGFEYVNVLKTTPAGETLLEVGEPGSGNSQFESPQDIAADSEGNVLVADTGNNRIQELNSEGEYVRKYGTEGSGNGEFIEPQGVAVDNEGRVWVSDTGNDRAQRFSAKGSYQAQFGSSGPNEGQLSEPTGLAVDSEERVWIADMGNDRVQKWKCE